MGTNAGWELDALSAGTAVEHGIGGTGDTDPTGSVDGPGLVGEGGLELRPVPYQRVSACAGSSRRAQIPAEADDGQSVSMTACSG